MRINKKFTIWWRSSSVSNRLSTYFKYRRVKEIDRLMQGELLNPIKGVRILELGCGMGVDFIRFLSHEKSLTLYGLDLIDTGICAKNFNMVVGDAEHLGFPDNYFHFLVSIGVLEHIQSVEKLANVIKEINRVSKSYCIVVPCMPIRLAQAPLIPRDLAECSLQVSALSPSTQTRTRLAVAAASAA